MNDVALDKFYSSLDLRSAYNQIALLPEEKQYTAFEAGGELLQFERFPFEVTNGTSAFQRTIDNFIKRYNLKKLHAYLDDITVTSSTMEDHDLNLKRPLDAAHACNLTLNEEKSKSSSTTIDMLGYRISQMKPNHIPNDCNPCWIFPFFYYERAENN